MTYLRVHQILVHLGDKAQSKLQGGIPKPTTGDRETLHLRQCLTRNPLLGPAKEFEDKGLTNTQAC